MAEASWLLYGANGYTGQRIAREAVARGLKLVLAGRDLRRIEPLARELGCPFRVFSLDDVGRIAAHLEDVKAVLHCAGPFTATGAPMMDACLQSGVHYLDITGEIPVIEAAAARHARAVQAGVCLIPSVGFDVVPSDCLAAMLAARVPGATHLQLAFTSGSRISPGTARTILGRLADGAWVRIDGRLVRVHMAWKSLDVPFRGGRQQAAIIAWGDVVTAWHTTGIPNIEVYAAMPWRRIRQIRCVRWLFPLMRLRAIRAIVGWAAREQLATALGEEQSSGRASLWGRVWDDHNHSVEGTLETPEGYRLTVLTALAAVEKVLRGGIPPGFSTPTRAFGAEFILGIPETSVDIR